MGGIALIVLGFAVAAVAWFSTVKAVGSKYEKALAVGLVFAFIIGMGLIITGVEHVRNALRTADTEYKVMRVVHYQALNAEEINQVWLKEDGGDYFYILVNDKEFFELREENEDGDIVMNLSDEDFTKIIRSK